ncbi:LPO_1073/Vpar_1526 family protein [Paenibacillus pseudetheri]|uniref:Uncharacterized protein n=1 Tax=Paenibacillus pseudetheri TaxID=2897682 RepID=A0ABN8FA15_9BACL|nr:LPO_1073/Vpar_1526 family protein [Paenibacillus pseudetheri]CAH1054027.1 hypothetical protein PAECIP111894_00172 [Paenibacillus pseudetheri]
MLGDKKEITAGDNSTNIQGKTVTIYNGISYMDAREIALQTFKDNFYELSEVAKNTALERAEYLINRFLEKLQKESPELIRKIIEPDIQYAVINAQKQYARNEKYETLEILSDLLKTRFQVEDEDSLKKITINESIIAMEKITITHIKYITALFLIKHSILHPIDRLFNLLELIITDDWSKYASDEIYFDHLEVAGVAKKEMINGYHEHLEPIIRAIYDKIELDGMAPYEEDISANELTRQKYFQTTERLALSKKWNESTIKKFTLTGVGKVLAISYLNSVLNTDFDINIWIRN